MHMKESKFIPSCLPKEEDIFLGLLNNYPGVWELLQQSLWQAVILAMLRQRKKFFSHLHLVQLELYKHWKLRVAVFTWNINLI